MTASDEQGKIVYVKNIDMPFSSMVGLVIKFWFATLAAGAVLAVMGALLMGLLAAMGIAIGAAR
jgi:hypothetical protein